MFILVNFLNGIAQVLDILLTLYMWMIIGRAIISWVSPDPYNPIVRFLYQATEPVLYQVRRYLPFFGGIDLSPIVVILLIVFIKAALINSLYQLAFRFR